MAPPVVEPSPRVGENRSLSRPSGSNLLVSLPPSSSSGRAAPSLADSFFFSPLNLGLAMERVGWANSRDSSFSRSSLTASFVIGCHGKTGFRVTELYPRCAYPFRSTLPASSLCLPSHPQRRTCKSSPSFSAVPGDPGEVSRSRFLRWSTSVFDERSIPIETNDNDVSDWKLCVPINEHRYACTRYLADNVVTRARRYTSCVSIYQTSSL